MKIKLKEANNHQRKTEKLLPNKEAKRNRATKMC
jgi:hypothetical protein